MFPGKNVLSGGPLTGKAGGKLKLEAWLDSVVLSFSER